MSKNQSADTHIGFADFYGGITKKSRPKHQRQQKTHYIIITFFSPNKQNTRVSKLTQLVRNGQCTSANWSTEKGGKRGHRKVAWKSSEIICTHTHVHEHFAFRKFDKSSLEGTYAAVQTFCHILSSLALSLPSSPVYRYRLLFVLLLLSTSPTFYVCVRHTYCDCYTLLLFRGPTQSNKAKERNPNNFHFDSLSRPT